MRRPYILAVMVGVVLLAVIEWFILHRDELVTQPDAGVTLDAGVRP
jgi:hypothetical protein